MLAVAIARYVTDRARLAAARPEHHAYARRLLDDGRLLVAGPFADETGAIFVFETESLEEVRELVAADPFQIHGVFSNVEVKAWTIRAVNSDALTRLAAPQHDA